MIPNKSEHRTFTKENIMKLLFDYYPTILQSLEDKLNEYCVTDVNPWNIEECLVEEKQKNENGQLEVVKVMECLVFIFTEIARLEGEYRQWLEVWHKIAPEFDYNRELMEKEVPKQGYSFPEGKHFWIDWIKLSKGTYGSVDRCGDCNGMRVLMGCVFETTDFRAWEPFFKVYKVKNDFICNILGVFEDDPSCFPGINDFLNGLVEYGYSREEAWTFFEPQKGYLADFYTQQENFPVEDAEKIYKRQVIKCVFNYYFPPNPVEKKYPKR